MGVLGGGRFLMSEEPLQRTGLCKVTPVILHGGVSPDGRCAGRGGSFGGLEDRTGEPRTWKRPPPQDHHRAQRICLLQRSRGVRFLVSEVSL